MTFYECYFKGVPYTTGR